MEITIINRSHAYPHRRAYRFVKRLMDLGICLLAVPAVLPLLLVCALAVILDSRGPAFFVQQRVGKGGRLFWMVKFRTMHYRLDDSAHRTFMKAFVKGDLDEHRTAGSAGCRVFRKSAPADNRDGQVFKPACASQITRVGRVLRKASLDELPQLWNVLRGEMSLVGPRPNVAWEVEEYQSWHNERLEVLPGITGLAQVRGRSGICFDNIAEYDIEYIENMNLLLDLSILWRTVSLVFAQRA
ncbi:MAG TPA: sugar transferase [Anaerolineae bacterium]|nr:sugar transferase [Anaerolineae bacterium]